MKKDKLHDTNWIAYFLLPLFWLIYPLASSDFVDMSDTQQYDNYFNYVGFRILIVTAVKGFRTFHLDYMYAAIFLNSMALFYLFFLFKRFGPKVSSWERMALFCTSPILLLSKNNICSDFYAGLIAFHGVLLFEEILTQVKKGAQVPAQEYMYPSLLFIMSENMKSTAVFVWFAYLIVFLIREAKTFKGVSRPIIRFVLYAFIFWGVELLVFQFIYNDPFYRYKYEFAKPKGGSGLHEIAGASASIPLPIFWFHIYSHLKVAGRLGLAGLIGFFAALGLRSVVPGAIYLVGLLFCSLLASKGYFTMERYWSVFLPFQLLLISLFAQKIRGFAHGKYYIRSYFVVGVFISLANYFFRYFPALYHWFGYNL